MKRKNIISLSVAFAFLSLSITGILLYIKQKAHAVEITHTIFGLIFVGFAIFHILNNWGSITGYSKERSTGKYQKEFLVALGVFGIVLIGGVTGILEPVAEAGRFLAPKRPPRPEQLQFMEVKTNDTASGREIRILIEKNKDTEIPQMAVWLETAEHSFIENLFVPAQALKMPESEEEAREGHFEKAVFNPKNLPQWSAKAGNKTASLAEETPRDNFVIQSKTAASGDFYVMAEISANGKTELYQGQANASNGGLFKLKSTSPTLLKSVMVDLN